MRVCLPLIISAWASGLGFGSSLTLTFVVALVAALILTPLVRWLACLAGAIDMPEARRIHSKPTPRWGGLAVYAAMLLALAGLTGIGGILPSEATRPAHWIF